MSRCLALTREGLELGEPMAVLVALPASLLGRQGESIAEFAGRAMQCLHGFNVVRRGREVKR